MLTEKEKTLILESFREGTLTTRSISPEGRVQWKPIVAVHKANTEWETIVKVVTENGEMILTGGHHVYISPTGKVEAETLKNGQYVQSVSKDMPYFQKVLSVENLPSRPFMYDVTVQDNHNLVLNNKTVVSNCPDRNYHFRPPTSEGTINKFNRVFAYVWEDEELIEYMQRGVDIVNLWPPETHWNTVDAMVRAKPAWRQMIFMGAMAHAAMALTLNWIADEFDYSVGGISLNIEKSSKYEGIKNNAEQQLDKLLEAKTRTVKITRGLQQSRYGIGLRSALGPHLGSGILSPRSYMGI